MGIACQVGSVLTVTFMANDPGNVIFPFVNSLSTLPYLEWAHKIWAKNVFPEFLYSIACARKTPMTYSYCRTGSDIFTRGFENKR